MSRIIPGNRPRRVYIHWSPPHIEDDLQSKVAQITNKDKFVLEEIITSSKEVFKYCESEMVVKIRMLGNPTRKTAESNVIV